MISLKEKLAELNKYYKENSDKDKDKDKDKGSPRDITQEFVIRLKIRDAHNIIKEWDELLKQQSEIEDKLQELEASPPRYLFIFKFERF